MSLDLDQPSANNSVSAIGRRILEYVLISVSAIISIKFVGWLAEGEWVDDWAISLVQLIVFVILVAVFYGFLFALKLNPWFRRFSDRRAKFEGDWFEIFYTSEQLSSKGNLKFPKVDVNEETGRSESSTKEIRPYYAHFTIEYVGPIENTYRLYGTAYYPNGLYHSRWFSRAVLFYLDEDRIEYLFSSTYNAKGGISRGVGSLSFNRRIFKKSPKNKKNIRSINTHYSKLHSGLGYFIDGGEQPTKFSLEFIRITGQEVEKLAPKLAIMHPEAVMRKYVMVYHKMFGARLHGGLRDPIKPKTKSPKGPVVKKKGSKKKKTAESNEH